VRLVTVSHFGPSQDKVVCNECMQYDSKLDEVVSTSVFVMAGRVVHAVSSWDKTDRHLKERGRLEDEQAKDQTG